MVGDAPADALHDEAQGLAVDRREAFDPEDAARLGGALDPAVRASGLAAALTGTAMLSKSSWSWSSAVS